MLELASQDRTRAIAGLFRLSDTTESEYTVQLRGIDASLRYEVTFDNIGEACLLDGYTLTKVGVTIRLKTALTSELLVVSAVD